MPVAAVRQVTVGGNLTEKQQQVTRLLAGPQRHTKLVGGARSGKTFILIRSMLVRALKAPGSRHIIIRLHSNAVRKSVWMDTLPKCQKICLPDLVFTPHEGEMYYKLSNGSEVWCGGLDDQERVDKILGLEYATMFFNECSQINYASILTARSRLAQTFPQIRNRCYYDLNPVGKGYWTYKLFVEKKNPASPLESISDPDEYQYAYLNPEDNAQYIDSEFLKELRSYPERQRKRFYEGTYVDQQEGALWTLEQIESSRVSLEDVPELQRVVIPVDPSGASGPQDLKADEIGIVVVARGVNGHYYVLEDNTGLYSPEQWGRVVRNQYHKYSADRVVGEKNFGGDMVRAVIQQGDANVSYKDVVASRGKVLRAEPVSALYERGLVHHVGRLPKLEDEMCSFTTAGYLGIGSPNRADALVHGLTELCGGGGGGWLDFYRSEAGLGDLPAVPSYLDTPLTPLTPSPAYGALVPKGVVITAKKANVTEESQSAWDDVLGRL